jgi:hypothetical protein
MSCARCGGASGGTGWCAPCERAYDAWVRRYASDVIVPMVGGMVVVALFGMALPLLGVGWLVGGIGAVLAFATIGGIAQLNRWRRRRQFQLGALPRALVFCRDPRYRDS